MKTFKQFQKTNAFYFINKLFSTGECRPVVAYGQGRRTSYIDHTPDILKFINPAAVEIGNDAPRGGAMGKYIKLKF